MPYTNLTLFQPEILLCLLGLAVIVLDLMVTDRRAARVTVLVVAIAGMAVCAKPCLDLLGAGPGTEFHGSYAVDGLAVFLKLLSLAAGILVLLLSADYFRSSRALGEYCALVVFLVLGMCLLAGANDLVLIYLSFELVSLTSYLLVAWKKRDPKSNEAGVKYFIYGAAASAVMLYGLTLIYGAGGSTNLLILADHFMQPARGAGLALVAALGILLLTVGLGYKISMAPFHMWAPDVYEGAPTPITALLSVGPKAAGFAILLRVAYVLAPATHVPWQVVLAVLAVLTMFVGNLLALRQTDIKRMLAYSSIAHAGYMLIGVVVGPGELWGMPAVMFYLVAYLLMNTGLFAVAILLERNTGSTQIECFAGLARAAPSLALVVVVLLLSLTGIPPTAGFLGKLYIFAAAIKSRQWAWLAVAGIVNSVISLYYYMNIARLMYFDKREAVYVPGRGVEVGVREGAYVPQGASEVGLVILLTGIGTLALFVAPGWLVEVARTVLMVR